MDAFYIHMNNTPVGDITIIEEDGCIAGLSLGISCPGEYRRTALLERAELQLEEYFRGERRQFDLPIDMKGTPFQHRVWQALIEIPWGETLTYSRLAQKIGRPNAARAVGGACGANPLLIIVPCHRVLGKNGLKGYAGGISAKKTLLKIENLGNNY